MKNNVFLLGTLLLVAAAALADDQQQSTQQVHVAENDANDRNTVAPTMPQTRMNLGDITIPSHFTSLLANGGAVAAGVILVVAVAALAMQVLSPRLCTYFNLCETPQGYQAYSAAPNSVYGDYQAGYPAQAGTYNAPVYQKRSLEYVGPILKALSNAYDKYARQVTPPAKKE